MSVTDPPESLRIEGGWWGGVRAAASGWWDGVIILTGLNLLWAIALLTVVLAPPATAAYHAVARRALQRDPFVGAEMFAAALRAGWRAAWGWALALLVVGGVAAANLWIYRDRSGLLWSALRWSWGAILIGWLSINLFFWPFWYAQLPRYRTLSVTWRNAALFVARHPVVALSTLLLVALLVALSMLTGVLLGTILIAWSALLVTAILAAHLPDEEE